MQYRAKETPMQTNTVSVINTTLEVVSGSPNDHHTGESVFDTIPLYRNYYVLPGRTMLARSNVVPYQAYVTYSQLRARLKPSLAPKSIRPLKQ